MDPSGCNDMGVDSAGYMARVDVEFQKIGLRGVTILATSGYGGAHTIADERCTAPTLLVDFPSSSPYVISVGATQVSINQGVSLDSPPQICAKSGVWGLGSGTEVAVDTNMADLSSGGGFSEVADQPSYQTAAVAAYLAAGATLPPSSCYNSSRRATSNVSALGPFVLTYSQDQIFSLYYDSMAVDYFAGVVSLLNQASIAASLSRGG